MAFDVYNIRYFAAIFYFSCNFAWSGYQLNCSDDRAIYYSMYIDGKKEIDTKADQSSSNISIVYPCARSCAVQIPTPVVAR